MLAFKAFIDRADNKLPKLTFSKFMVFKAESIDATTLTIEPFSCEKSQGARTMCVCKAQFKCRISHVRNLIAILFD